MHSSSQCGLDRIGVLLADPSYMSRDLISKALEQRSQFHLVGSVSRADELVIKLQNLPSPPDVALISATLEEGPLSGLSVLSKLQGEYPHLRLILLMDRSEPDVVAQAFHSGVRGVFARSEQNFKGLCKCVRCVHMGQIWASTQHIEQLVNALRQAPRLQVANSAGISLLCKREEDVVSLVAAGMSNREISVHLGLSEHTVKNYLFRIFDKLGVSSRTELVLRAVSSSKEQLPLLESGGSPKFPQSPLLKTQNKAFRR
jgi:DNA-binding NarL/FixJ family response regulator